MTEPVTIRLYEESDVEQLTSATLESVAEVSPWMPWCRSAYSETDAANYIGLTRAGHVAGTMYEFAIIGPHGEYAGGCGLNRISMGVANLGYWIRSSLAGRGIAPAAVRRLVAWAFERTSLNRLEIVAAVGNVRSQRVAEKVGASRDAVLKKKTLVNGVPADAVLYSIVRPDR